MSDPSEKPQDTSPSQKSQKTVSDALVTAVLKTDETVLRLNRLLSTKSGLDIILSNLNHSSHALHYFLALRPTIRLWILRRLGRDIPVIPASATSSSAQPPLLAFSSLISKTRFTIRLLTLVSLWSWGSSTYKAPPKDPVLRVIGYLEVLLLVIYQYLENVTYLAANGIVGATLIKRTGGATKWGLWSTRAWFGYVLIQFVKLSRESTLFNQKEAAIKNKRAEQVSLSVGENAASESLEAEEAELEAIRYAETRAWRKSLVNNLAWAPLCAHWSFENGIGVPASLTGIISWIAGAWGTYDAWQATALS